MSAPRRIDDLIALIRRGRVLLPDGRDVTIAEAWHDAETDPAARWIAPGDRVVLSEPAGADLVRATLAVWAQGGVAVFGVDPHRCGDWPADVRVRSWPDGAVLHDASPRTDAVAVIHTSSGTTGRPKLARRSFESLAAEAERYAACYAPAAGARAYLAAPITHSFAFGAMLGLLAAGCVVQVAPVFRPRALADALRGGADIVVLTPPMARLAIEAAQERDQPLRCAPQLVIAGAGAVPGRLDAEFRRAFGCGLARNYGASETGASFGAAQSLPEGCLGRPFRGVRVVSPRPGDHIGELIVDLDHPILSLEGKTATPPMQRGLWRSGDLAEVDDDQRVWLRGRIDDRVKINGHLIDCAALAAQARAAPGVSDAVALALPRPQRGEIHDLVLICECRDEAVSAADISLAAMPQTPMIVLTRTEFPRTAAGKPDRDQLRSFAEARLRRGAARGEMQGEPR
ncbi:AMP-dependent synthetase and ligase [Rhodopseudomonas palustris HaA2]|uniref:AMP-dependent synthetase and ligase n=1 Tax=Rhodopseudomonas palustris (strain HaA2) TaxID=316058 RepID=Q2IYD5_RHOP2|nr:fatty acid--CoA ligase family protein [Rhodopseudomonas palustris]ABD06775.1 AMP-dependent synthetase and ligase [Rhodopseudomonas palustris HaA2]